MKRYYFYCMVTYRTGVMTPMIVSNAVADQHPFTVMQMFKTNRPELICHLMSFQEITEEDYNLWTICDLASVS